MRMNKKVIALVAAAMTIFSACSKDVQEEENDNEVVTTLELHITEKGGASHFIYKFDDPDGFGAGTQPPVVDIVKLGANKVYDVELKLLNNTANPVEDVTGEVEDEAAAHRFYILPDATSNIAVSGMNTDLNGVAVATTSVWTTGAPGTGKLRIVLRHYPDGDKAADDPVNSPKSSTDVDTEFSTVIE
jgi:hypothetical protein